MKRILHRITQGTLLVLLCCWIPDPALAQDGPFRSKSDKKLYNKLEKAYEKIDYNFILQNEDQILESFMKSQDTLSALMYSFLGEAHYEQSGDLVKSLDYYQKEYDLREKIQKRADYEYTNLAYQVAALKDDLGYYEDSEELYKEMLAEDEKRYGKDHENYIESALSFARHYLISENPEPGIEILKTAEKGIDKDSEQYARMLITYGQLYRDMGSLKKAMKNYDQAYKMLEDLGLIPSPEAATLLNEIYYVQADEGKYPEAEETLNNAIAMLDRMDGDQSDISSAYYHNLGEVQMRLGNYSAAVSNLQRSMDIVNTLYGEESTLAVEDLNLMSRVHYEFKRYDQAEETINKAIAISEQGNLTEQILYYNLLSTLAGIYQDNGQVNRSISLREKTVENYKRLLGEDSWEYATELHALGKAQQKLANLSEAEKSLLKSYDIRRRSLGKYHRYSAASTRQLAILNWKKNENKKALAYFDDTFDNYFKQIEAFFPTLSEEEKAKFYNNRIKTSFEQFNSFAINNLEKNPELAGTMYDYQLATKGIIMYATTRVRESILNSGDQNLIDKYTEWISQKEQLAKLFSTNNLDLDERNRKIEELLNSSNDLEKELGKLSADFATTYSKSNYSWRDVQKKLKDGEAALEIIRVREYLPDSAGMYSGKVNYVALIVKPDTKGQPELVVLENGDKMETRYLANYRNGIRFKVKEKYSHKLFWEPIAPKLEGIKKIYFSPDGVYNQISLYTLRNPETDRYLIDDLEIQLVTNTKDLLAFDKDASAGFNKNAAYLFGYPNYNLGIVEESNYNQDEIKKAAQQVTENISLGRGNSRGGRGGTTGGVTRSGNLSRGVRGNLQRYVSGNSLLALLPGTQKEINNIQQLYQENSYETVKYDGNEALEDAVKNIKNPQTLHVATHGFFLENQESGKGEENTDEYVSNPMLRSGLIFAGANSFLTAGAIDVNGSYEEDGILTAYEVMNMSLNDTELVVLSACETGLGKVTNGEGVYGLQRAFQIAGTESIIMSMWTVDDNATQELMNTFYEEWMNTKDKKKAFNIAQKKIKDKWKDPYYWGAFVMVGI